MEYSSRAGLDCPCRNAADRLTSCLAAIDRAARSSHRGGQGFESPQLHPAQRRCPDLRHRLSHARVSRRSADSCPDPLELQPDRQLALIEVQVFPHEPKYLTAPQTEDQDEHVRRVEHVRGAGNRGRDAIGKLVRRTAIGSTKIK